jgi:tetraacyldisaccharide 4'-kinase
MNIVNAWYRKSLWLWLLWPLSLLYVCLARLRRARLEAKRTPSISTTPPVLVVGNITVGGTGKTPLVIALVRLLSASNIKVGIVSRGYRGQASTYPLEVTGVTSVEEAGDEAVLMRRSLACPIFVDRVRVRAVAALSKHYDCDLIISDDGLQHYAMARALELVVIDGERLLGNGLCLPAGPLRERPARLLEVDYLMFNGAPRGEFTLPPVVPEISGAQGPFVTQMALKPVCWINLANGSHVALESLPVAPNGRVHAIAGIGNPARFFAAVKTLGYDPLCHPFPDHYEFSEQDLRLTGEQIIVMTQKDAVKCERFAGENCWYLAIDAILDDEFLTNFSHKIGLLLAARAEKLPGKNKQI